MQWRGAQLAGLVTAGSGCDRYKDDQWPTGFPPDWPPLPAGIEVTPGSITMTVKGLGLNAAATATVLNHTTSDVTVQVGPRRGTTSPGPAARSPPPPTAGSCRSR